MSHLEKEDNQERELCMEKKIKGESKVLTHLRKIISVCESKENDDAKNRQLVTWPLRA